MLHFRLPNNYSHGRSTLSNWLAENFFVFAVKRVEGQGEREVLSEHTTLSQIRLGISGKERPLPECESRARDTIGNRTNI
jgi:hypothetical protein